MGLKKTASEILDQHGRPMRHHFSQVKSANAFQMLEEYRHERIYAPVETQYSRFWEAMELRKSGELQEAKIGLEISGEFLFREADGSLKPMQIQGFDHLRECRRVEYARLRESSSFWDTAGGSTSSDTTAFDNEYAPTIGPAGRQLYLSDMLSAQARCFFEYNHNPVAKRCIQMIRHFVLGRGVVVKCKDPKAQEHWDLFEKQNRLRRNLQMWHDDFRRDGDIFLRFFEPKGVRKPLIVRSLDPSTIWEIVTDPEDIGAVLYYHQQYQTPYQMFTVPGVEMQRYIVRQIRAEEVIHHKINCSAHEKRGRSDLYPVLTWLKVLKDYIFAKAVKAKIQAAFVWDVLVKGVSGDVSSLDLSLPDPEHPGSWWLHNEAMELTPQASNVGAGSGKADNIFYDILTLIALGVGLSKEFLGTSDTGGTRAAAILASEPTTKFFEDCQDDVEDLYHEMAEKVFAYAIRSGQLPKGTKTDIEVILPEIASEETTKKIALLGKLEANEVISKETSAEMQAAEVRITTYDFQAEREKIKKEKAEGGFWLHKDNAQVPKWKETGALSEPQGDEEQADKDNVFGSGRSDLKREFTRESDMFRGMAMRFED